MRTNNITHTIQYNLNHIQQNTDTTQHHHITHKTNIKNNTHSKPKHHLHIDTHYDSHIHNHLLKNQKQNKIKYINTQKHIKTSLNNHNHLHFNPQFINFPTQNKIIIQHNLYINNIHKNPIICIQLTQKIKNTQNLNHHHKPKTHTKNHYPKLNPLPPIHKLSPHIPQYHLIL